MPSYLSSIFVNLGLKERDANIYLACAQSSRGLFIHEIVKATGIKRSTVVVSVERLCERGLIMSFIEGARRRFRSEEPEKVFAQYAENFNNLKTLIPLLLANQGDKEKTKIRFFEGSEGIRNIYSDIRLVMHISKEKNKKILAISSGQDAFKVLPDHQKSHIDKRVKERIELNWIAPDTSFNRTFMDTDGSAFRKMKFFDEKKFPFHIEIDIYGNSVAFMELSDKPSGVIIENAKLTSSLRSIFKLLWSLLPE